MMGHILHLNERHNKLDKRLGVVEKKICKLENTTTKTGQLNKMSPDELKDLIDARVEEGINEYRERETRKTNVIMHNIPESNLETPEERKAADKKYVMDIAEQMKVQDIEIQSIIRLGRKINKTRMMKVQ